MKTLVIWTFIGLAVIIGIMVFPTLHGYAGTLGTDGMFPLLAGTFTLFPYLFLGVVGYFVWKVVRR